MTAQQTELDAAKERVLKAADRYYCSTRPWEGLNWEELKRSIEALRELQKPKPLSEVVANTVRSNSKSWVGSLIDAGLDNLCDKCTAMVRERCK